MEKAMTRTAKIRVVRRTFLNGWEMSAASDGVAETARLELCVIFTGVKGTEAALNLAAVLARDLDARIHVVATLEVPLEYSLKEPPAAVARTESDVLDAIAQPTEGAVETVVDLYFCREKLESLGQLLRPRSIVLIGQPWYPFSEPASIAAALKAIGHEVITVPARIARRGLATRKAREVEQRINARHSLRWSGDR